MFFSKIVPETWSLISPFIDDVLDELYDHALAHDTTAKLFAGHNIDGLKAVQKTHWELTFKNGFGTAYEERAYRIGHSHAKIGLTPSIFTDSYGFMMERLVHRILASGKLTKHSVCAEKMQEITHVIFRDLSRVLDIYYQVLEERRVKASQYVLDQSREFSQRMSLVSDDVQSVATAVDQMDGSIIKMLMKALLTPAPLLNAQIVPQNQCNLFLPLPKKSDHSCQSSPKLRI